MRSFETYEYIKAIARAAIVVAALTFSVDFATAGCGPFGNPPAEVNRGWFATFASRHSPVCAGGRLVGPWKDADGDERNACLYEPAYASRDKPLPLIVFLHPSVATADSILLTGLTDLIDKADLGGKQPGFILLAPQGRYTSHFYPGFDSDGFGWDNWYRQFGADAIATVEGTAYQENVDASAIDHVVAEMVGSGKVDTRRIYLMGWSNGAAMALLYAMNRPWVAAAAVYSAPDPLAALFDICPQTPVSASPSGYGQLRVMNPVVPMMHVRNACDIGGICPNGSRFASRVRTMGGNIEDVILDSSGNLVARCDETCGADEMADGQVASGAALRGLVHHMRWPRAWNENMLAFLMRHALPGGLDRRGVRNDSIATLAH